MDVWSDASHFNLFHIYIIIIMTGFPEQGVREAVAWPPSPPDSAKRPHMPPSGIDLFSGVEVERASPDTD